MQSRNMLGFATRCVHAGQNNDPTTGAVMTPIYATSTYAQSSPGVHKGFEYARTQNPTRMALERCIADLEGGTAGFAFASGLAATATVLDCLEEGSHIVVGDDVYGGTRRLFDMVRRQSAGVEATYADLSDPDALDAVLRPDTRLIWLETPTNPTLKIIDLERVAAVARAKGVLTACDNTFASPWTQRPLEYGFDLVMHSTTKYLNGHSDMVGGIVVVGENAALRERLAFLQNRRRHSGAVRFIPRASRGQDARPAHGAPIGFRATHCRTPRRQSAHRPRVLSGPRLASAVRSGAAADARLRRDDFGRGVRLRR